MLLWHLVWFSYYDCEFCALFHYLFGTTENHDSALYVKKMDVRVFGMHFWEKLEIKFLIWRSFLLELRCSSQEYPLKNDIFMIILVKICMGKICFTEADANILFNLLNWECDQLPDCNWLYYRKIFVVIKNYVKKLRNMW